MDKVLSIIIPTYNMEKYLRKCLDSLIVSDENMQWLEVLVVNDGSKDSSSQIAHEYEAKYPQTFRVIDKENGNYGSCINRGLKEATGKYVKVLDADDYSEPSTLNEYLLFLAKNDADAFITDFEIVDSSGNVTGKRDFTRFFQKEGIVVSFPDLLANKKDVAFQMHALTYRLSMIREMGYKQTEGISYTDTEWATIPMTRVKFVCYFHDSIYRYLVGREGQTMANYYEVANYKDFFMIIENISKYYQEKPYQDIYDVYIKNKLKKVLSGIYEAGLKFHSISEKELRSYDERLIQYPRAYKLADNLKLSKGPINYVKYWRSDNPIRFFVCVKFLLLIKKIFAR